MDNTVDILKVAEAWKGLREENREKRFGQALNELFRLKQDKDYKPTPQDAMDLMRSYGLDDPKYLDATVKYMQAFEQYARQKMMEKREDELYAQQQQARQTRGNYGIDVNLPGRGPTNLTFQQAQDMGIGPTVNEMLKPKEFEPRPLYGAQGSVEARSPEEVQTYQGQGFSPVKPQYWDQRPPQGPQPKSELVDTFDEKGNRVKRLANQNELEKGVRVYEPPPAEAEFKPMTVYGQGGSMEVRTEDDLRRALGQGFGFVKPELYGQSPPSEREQGEYINVPGPDSKTMRKWVPQSELRQGVPIAEKEQKSPIDINAFLNNQVNLQALNEKSPELYERVREIAQEMIYNNIPVHQIPYLAEKQAREEMAKSVGGGQQGIPDGKKQVNKKTGQIRQYDAQRGGWIIIK